MIPQAILWAALLPVALAAAHAAPVTVYECTGADGMVTVQTRGPCPEGHAQRTRTVDPPAPASRPPAHAEGRVLRPPQLPQLRAVGGPADAQAAATPAPPPPPPPLYQCTRADGSRYLHENGNPPSQCLPLQTVGIGGVPGVAAGRACERVRDTCTPVPAEALCQAWETRLREAGFRWKFASSPDNAGTLQARYEALARIHAASACAHPSGQAR